MKILKKYILAASLQLGTKGTLCSKKLTFNKKRLFVVSCKIKFLKCNTLQNTSGVHGIDREVS